MGLMKVIKWQESGHKKSRFQGDKTNTATKVTLDGTFMVFDVIPFKEVKSIWIGKSNGGKRLEYGNVKRAYSKRVENKTKAGATLCTSSKTWLIVHANCFGKTSWEV